MSQEIKNVQVFQREDGTRITWNYYNCDCKIDVKEKMTASEAVEFLNQLTEYEHEESVVIIEQPSFVDLLIDVMGIKQ